jgi:NAD(P)-dependent dehydrogenase (short-subunit alcohol dehydrogenase family)
MTPEQERYWAEIHTLKRIGEFAEVANGVVFLASGEASFISGHGLAIDGGASTFEGR